MNQEEHNVLIIKMCEGKRPTVPYTTTYTNTFGWYDDYCDCDERCPHCGKKKRPKYPFWHQPYRVTCRCEQ